MNTSVKYSCLFLSLHTVDLFEHTVDLFEHTWMSERWWHQWLHQLAVTLQKQQQQQQNLNQLGFGSDFYPTLPTNFLLLLKENWFWSLIWPSPLSDTLAAEVKGQSRSLHHSAATQHTDQWSSEHDCHALLPTLLDCWHGHGTAEGSVPFQMREVSTNQCKPQTKWIRVQVTLITRCIEKRMFC